MVVENARVDAEALPESRFDLIVDSYASCHILSIAGRLTFLRALMDRLRPGGLLYTAGMGCRDGYYGEHLRRGAELIATDPMNEICKLLQTEQTPREDEAHIGYLIATTSERFTEDSSFDYGLREVRASVLGTRRP